jgi:hypothetical protein
VSAARRQWLHRAGPDSPKLRGYRWKLGAYYVLTGPPEAPQVLSGPHLNAAAAWAAAPLP